MRCSRDPSYVNTFVDQVKSVTADEVREAAGTWLDPDARAVVRYLAEDEAEVAA